jgi:drug/metabolite transporter (DMT)-like permease
MSMPPSHLLGVVLALISATSWGGGDFSGGRAARRHNAIQVLALAALASLAVLMLLALLRGEHSLSAEGIGWSAAAGVSGALGTVLLYRGLARGGAATMAPTAAVVGAAVPVLFAALSQGLPGGLQLAGFAAGLGGITLVSRVPPVSPGPDGADSPGSGSLNGMDAGHSGSKEVGLAVLSGLGFGGFFVFISLGQEGQLFAPLIVSKLASLAVGLILMGRRRLPFPSPTSNPAALLAGVLDMGGNVFYLLARQLTRLDIAAVIASMYPAVTVLLARCLLHEEVSRHQWAGLVLCLLSVSLIAL